MKKYQVLQGKIKNNGSGNYNVVKEVDTLEEAIVEFNQIKNEKRGWGRFVNGDVLETWLLESNNWDEPIGYWSC